MTNECGSNHGSISYQLTCINGIAPHIGITLALQQLCIVTATSPLHGTIWNRNSSQGENVNNAAVQHVQHVQHPSCSRLKLAVSIISPLAILVSLFLKQHYVCGMYAACLCLLRKSHSCALRASPVSFKH